MNKKNFLLKYLKNIINFINSLLEKNLNKLNFKNHSYLIKNNKIIFTFVALFVLFISYLLIPTFFKQSEISKELKFELYSKLGLNFKFSNDIRYNIFPKPHFTTSELIIIDNENKSSKIDKLKVFVSFDSLLSLKNIQLKDIIFENANFNLNKKNYKFFSQLLNKEFQDGNLTIKNSNIFFKNLDDEVLFINKILKMKYYYEPKEFKNIFYSENEVFNIPYSMKSFYNKDKSKIFSNVNLKLMKLKIENELTFENDVKIGKAEITLRKLKRVTEYKIDNNNFNFEIYEKANKPNILYKGEFNIKPFYASLKGDLDEINLSQIFGSNAIIAQLLKTEIFNNKNIDFELNINANKIYKNASFRNIILNAKIKDGLIDTDNTKFEWRKFADFELIESLIFVRNGELVLDGKLKINVNNNNEIYKILLTPKKYRNKIKQIDLNFTYNFDQMSAKLKDIKIDNKINQNVNKILNDVLLKSDNLQNRIYFRNLLNEAIKSYAG